jgi:hypothetical protein
VSVSRADYEALVARQARKTAQKALQATIPVTEGWQGGALVVWCPGTPRNPLNGQRGHWAKHARWAKEWRERAEMRLYVVMTTHPWNHWPPHLPKRVTFTVYGRARFDDDNVRGVVKPLRDALQDMRVIDSDGNPAHTFHYEQAPPKRAAGAPHGIAIRIEVQG